MSTKPEARINARRFSGGLLEKIFPGIGQFKTLKVFLIIKKGASHICT
ncbi:hypothetical protein [Moorena sp. SIO3H5]|nr:hypothetical protein [Moorena sp. SIO3H5]NEO69983.1 hypothetical protein [Moorena sp. SIO3H5]